MTPADRLAACPKCGCSDSRFSFQALTCEACGYDDLRWDRLDFQTRWDRSWRTRQVVGRRVTVVPAVAPALPQNRWSLEGYALVPLVPPGVKQHHALDGCHVLWEVERWAEQPRTARPDRDPYLLRHVGGDLWAVLGEWELTEVERAVMQGRRQA